MTSSPGLGGATETSGVSGVRFDWIMLALPTIVAIQVVNAKAAVAILALLLLIGFAERSRPLSVHLQIGPFLLLAAAAGFVISRPEVKTGAMVPIALVTLIALVALQRAAKADARSLIVSLVDGVGIYLVINFLGFLAGLQSPGAADRIGGVQESTGFTRVTFPFTPGLDTAPTLAAVYLAAAPLAIMSERRLRPFRIICLLTGFWIAWSGASRTALFIAVALPILGWLVPSVLRWLAPAAAVFASVSALLAPPLMAFAGQLVSPILRTLAPGRDTSAGDIESLSNRTLIWSRSLKFWVDHVPAAQQLTGFGQNGQYRSGASLTYADILMAVVRNPRRGTTHNSYLQQLYDGGVVGWVLLSLAVLWVCVRLSQRLDDWAIEGRMAILAACALLFSSVVAVTLAPGAYHAGFMILIALTAIACQVPGCRGPDPDDIGTHEHIASHSAA